VFESGDDSIIASCRASAEDNRCRRRDSIIGGKRKRTAVLLQYMENEDDRPESVDLAIRVNHESRSLDLDVIVMQYT